MTIALSVVAALVVVAIIVTALLIHFLGRPVDDFSSVDTSTAEGVVEYHETEGETPYLLKRKADGSVSDEPFKVFVTTDTHLQADRDYEFTLTVLGRMLDIEKPDLVVINGDVIVSTEGYALHARLGQFFEERSQYWAFVLGNHDAEDYIKEGGRKKFVEAFSPFPHCLTRNEDPDIFGETNFIINIKGSEKITKSLIFLDSGYSRPSQEHFAEFGIEYSPDGDDFIKPNQIEWYKRRITEIKEENGGELVKSEVFLHIPLYQYETAFEDAKSGKAGTFVYGNKIEGACRSAVDTGFFAAAKEMGSTTDIIVGHDHDNDYCVNLDGINLLYAQSLAYLAYNSRKSTPYKLVYALNKKKGAFFTDGATLLMIQGNGSTEISVKRNAFVKGIFKGLEKRARALNLAF